MDVLYQNPSSGNRVEFCHGLRGVWYNAHMKLKVDNAVCELYEELALVCHDLLLMEVK